MEKIAEVIINNSVRQLGKVFHYIIPENLANKIEPGHLVSVPFGKSNRMVQGFVVGTVKESDFTELKEISEVLVKESLFNKKLLELAYWMSSEYMCNISECLRLMLPPEGSLITQQENLILQLKKPAQEVRDLLEAGKIRGRNQVKLLQYLLSNGQCAEAELVKKLGIDYSVSRSVALKELVEISREVIDKSPLKGKNIEQTLPFVPNQSQMEVLNTIGSYIDNEKSEEFLLHGVTGSGKTEVYLQLIAKVLNKGKQAVVLVPEISLTPQMIQRFVGRFGQQVAILHSRLSDGERSDQWRKIKDGKVQVAIGARSAVFAPFSNLGIIIIDEEHEHTYKSEKAPRYHVRDIARKRMELEGCILLMGSATPSIETYHRALHGEIKLVEMPVRANNSLLPQIDIIDMRRELEAGNKTLFSRSLFNAIKENIEKGNQTILFLNRRGYSSFVLCRKCGYVAKCKHCNISLTYHLHANRLLCHYCGYNIPNYDKCPSCGSEYIRHFGVGTQRIEEEVRKFFPTATVLRMDMDTTTRKNSHEEILKKFKDENINILIGTQMIAKGHDFPNVTLVGVISADLMLNLEDFRSTEKTFQLLTQVAGRAGRADKEGKVIVQTYETDNFSIQTAKKQDYPGFYNQEIVLRSQLAYPPFRDIISIMITGENIDKVKEAGEMLEKLLNSELNGQKEDIIVSKAVPAPVSKIKNRHRWRIIIKLISSEPVKEIINTQVQKTGMHFEKWCSISMDINPLNML